MSGRNMALGGLRIASPIWLGVSADDDILLPGGAKLDASQWNLYTADVPVTLSADATQGATTLAVNALSGPIRAGAVLNFGVPGLLAYVQGAVAASATSIPVFPLSRLVPSGSTTTFKGYPMEVIPSGTLVSRTFAQRASNAPFHPAVATDDEIMIVAFDVSDALHINDCELVMGTRTAVIKENLLPEWATISANSALLTQLRARFTTTTGVE